MSEIKVKKTTKKENFTAIKEFLVANGKEELAKVMEHELELLAKKNSGEKKPTENQLANEKIKETILQVLQNGRMTVSEMQKANEELAPLSTSKISALVKQLKESGVVVREENKRKAYFSIA